MNVMETTLIHNVRLMSDGTFMRLLLYEALYECMGY